MTSRTERTRERIVSAALALFAQHGFDQVTVNEIAAAANVSHMTVFRHFPTKEDIVVGDPFDPLMAAAVAAQPANLAPLERARRGLIKEWLALRDGPQVNSESQIQLIQLITGHSGLRARMWEANHATQQAIAAALREGGASALAAEAAAGACIGALTAALLAWGANPAKPLNDTILAALEALAPAGDQL